MKKLFIWLGIVCAIWAAFHLGSMWVTNNIYSAIDDIHETVKVYNAGTIRKSKDSRIMDKYR